MNEAARQAALMAAIAAGGPLPGVRERGDRAARGLAAYRGNAAAIAERALAVNFPRVRTAVGVEVFEVLATHYRRAEPPRDGDLGEWGAGFPAWLAAKPAFTTSPWLADAARLDWAVHACERAADAELDVASLQRLGTDDPAGLRLVPMPGLAVIVSAWPIAALHALHEEMAARFPPPRRFRPSHPDEAPIRAPRVLPAEADEDDDAPTLSEEEWEKAFEAKFARFDALSADVRQAFEEHRQESVVVARAGWRAVPTVVDPATAAACEILFTRPLAEALDHLAATPPRFDFTPWLAQAVREHWLQRVDTVER